VTYVKALIAAYFQESSFAFVSGFYSYRVSLAFRFRDRAETLTQVVECRDGKPRDSLWGGANCAGPDEDGSHLALQGRQVLVIAIPNGANLWVLADQPAPRHRQESVRFRRQGLSSSSYGPQGVRGPRLRQMEAPCVRTSRENRGVD
jgi:hypothetical protein